jgi:hypothetical protein
MSHTVKIQTKFKNENFNAFRRALEHHGWTLKENDKARTYPGDPAQHTNYPFVAVNPQANGYDIGLRVEEGDISVFCDFYGGSITKTLGQDLNELRKEYAFRVIEERLANEGYSVSRTINQDGTVDVVAE